MAHHRAPNGARHHAIYFHFECETHLSPKPYYCYQFCCCYCCITILLDANYYHCFIVVTIASNSQSPITLKPKSCFTCLRVGSIACRVPLACAACAQKRSACCRNQDMNFNVVAYPRDQNSPKALYIMVFRPKSLNI